MNRPPPASPETDHTPIPQGFLASGVGRWNELGGHALVLMPRDPVASVDHRASAAVTTRHPLAAPSVLRLRTQTHISCVAINSGNANAGNGKPGVRDNSDAAFMVRKALELKGHPEVPVDEIAILSTGFIGRRMNMTNFAQGVTGAAARLSGSPGALESTALAMMTTDWDMKIATATNGSVFMAGVAKGSGMTSPSLATCLMVVTTDGIVDPTTLQESLTAISDQRINSIEIDGVMSTNDAAVLLASGASGVTLARRELNEMLDHVLDSLGKQLIFDAEIGVKRLLWTQGELPTPAYVRVLSVQVNGAASDREADSVARQIVRTPVVGNAVAHDDRLDTGLLYSAAGSAMVRVGASTADLNYFSIKVDEHRVCEHDLILAESVPLAGKDGVTVTCEVSIGNGPGQALVTGPGVSFPGYLAFG